MSTPSKEAIAAWDRICDLTSAGNGRTEDFVAIIESAIEDANVQGYWRGRADSAKFARENRAAQPQEYPNPTDSDLKDPDFEAVWDAIKKWDLSRYQPEDCHRLYSGATGNDVMHILRALKHSERNQLISQLDTAVEALKHLQNDIGIGINRDSLLRRIKAALAKCQQPEVSETPFYNAHLSNEAELSDSAKQ